MNHSPYSGRNIGFGIACREAYTPDDSDNYPDKKRLNSLEMSKELLDKVKSLSDKYNTMKANYFVEMYPSEYGGENLDWTKLTPILCFEEAYKVHTTLTESCPGYKYRITKITREQEDN